MRFTYRALLGLGRYAPIMRSLMHVINIMMEMFVRVQALLRHLRNKTPATPALSKSRLDRN